jgi:multiple sugar transport system permease protein
MTTGTIFEDSVDEAVRPGRLARYFAVDGRRRYMLFVMPAIAVMMAVIIFPWIFTLFMSMHDWRIGQAKTFIGFDNYTNLVHDERFINSVLRTLVYTVLATVLPLIFGILSALVFHRRFPLRGVLRAVFIMPMMATPVAVALVWTMMFHPQLGVLNYLLSLVGIPPSLWVFDQATVIPSLVLVETWQWTPLVMLIVLGGLASLPTEPYESALIDGATPWQMFRNITFPLVLPFIMVATIIRTIDAVKSFDTIFVITLGGPGTASETINLYLYTQAFAFYQIGYASAMVVVFMVVIMALCLILLYLRQRAQWN